MYGYVCGVGVVWVWVLCGCGCCVGVGVVWVGGWVGERVVCMYTI